MTRTALGILIPELTFLPVEEVTGPGPFAYVLVDRNGAIHYPGKSDRADAKAVRILEYATFGSEIAERIKHAQEEGEDPESDPIGSADWLRWWPPITRYAHEHGLTVYAASVAATGYDGRTWEARVKALAGLLTNLESIQGGSAWEANNGTLRGNGYEWAAQQLTDLRTSGVI